MTTLKEEVTQRYQEELKSGTPSYGVAPTSMAGFFISIYGSAFEALKILKQGPKDDYHKQIVSILEKIWKEEGCPNS